ncbi:MAG: hypothetical protein IPI91_04050 [Flavobacteriales bacterium]|nr:hypothetical protein [Flavobacteriales bacterium]
MKPIMRDSLLTALPHHVIKTFNRNGSEQEVKFWYMPYTGTEPTFDVSQPLYDKDRMYALVEDSLVTVVQRTTFNSILQPVQSMAR